MTTATASNANTKTASKPSSAKKRGGYSFSPSTPASNDAAKKTATKAKKAVRKVKTAAKKSANKNAATTKRSFDLGLASISKSSSTASNAARQTASTVKDSVNRGSQAFSGAFANASANAKQMQEKVGNIRREASDKLAKAANKAAQTANKSFEIQRQTAEAAAQSYATASQAAKQNSQQLASFINNLFTQNVEAARKALECRNVSELFELQSQTARNNIESSFKQALKLSEQAIESATQAMGPLNESVSKNSKKFAELVS